MMTNRMNGTKLAVWMGLLLAGAVGLAGCGQASSTDAKSFDSAPPEMKAAWDKAVAADKANDYVAGVTGYKQILLQRDQLSPGQLKAAESAYGKLMQRLLEASGKGDPAAQQALTALNPTRQRGPSPPR